MRISRDATSYRARGVLKRDARHTKVPDDWRPAQSSKDTKRWCGGHVGREHTPKCFEYASDERGRRIYRGWRTFTCTKCGRQLGIYYGFRPKPDWVTC